MRVVLLFTLVAAVYCTDSGNKNSTTHRVTHTAWLDIGIANKKVGRIVIGLFGKVVPMTVINFVNLANKPHKQGYKGSKFYFIRKDIIMGGDWVSGDGRGGTSSYDNPKFDTENYIIKHYGAGWVSSYSYEVDGHSSLFMITLRPTPEYNGHAVVFGKVIKGMDVVRTIAEVPIKNGKPSTDVIIYNCGAELADPPFFVLKDDATD